MRRSFSINFLQNLSSYTDKHDWALSQNNLYKLYLGNQNQDRYTDEFMQGMSAIEI